MFPILSTIDEGWTAAVGFMRAYPRQSLLFVLVYLGAAGVGVGNFVVLPLPVWLAGLALTWGLGVTGLILLAPVWTALYRYAVLGDRNRRYWQFDVRLWRVLVVMVVMALIMLIGAVPFALGLDVLQLLGGRRMFVAGIVGFAFTVKALAFWLNARLAIAPAMGATGTRPQAMDTSWAYTRWASAKILVMLLLVYLPMLCASAFFAILAVLFHAAPGSTGAMVLTVANVVTTTLVSALTDLVWGAITGRLALKLVQAYRQRTVDLAKDQVAVDDT